MTPTHTVKPVNLGTFDAERFLEDHKHLIRLGSGDQPFVYLGINIDNAQIDDAHMYLESKVDNRTPRVEIPQLLKGELESEIARLKNALKIITYLAPYCQEEGGGGMTDSLVGEGDQKKSSRKVSAIRKSEG
jgi:hypothetical protein